MSMPIPTGLPANDVHQWLNGGWIFVNTEAGRVVGRFEMCDSDIIRYVRDGNMLDCNIGDIEAHWPACGAVNVEGYAVVLTRSSRQQYRRTYNNRVLTVDIPRKWDVMKRVGTEIVSSPDEQVLVEAAFSPRYFTYDQALAKLDEGWVTVALNPHLIIAGSAAEHLVYYRRELTARIEGSEIAPIGDDPRVVGRLLKFFDERVTLCMSTRSARTTETLPEDQASASGSS